MPPKGMFRDKLRPHGLEFATCQACNNGTSGADAVAAFVARMNPKDGRGSWRHAESMRLIPTLSRKAPGFLPEIMNPSKQAHRHVEAASGLILPAVEVTADGPITMAYLSVFTAKMGMALYREHIGEALPLEGEVYGQWHLNGGMSQQLLDAMVSMLPAGSTLRQGETSYPKQFSYRYNSDEKSIVAATTHFHGGLYLFNIATSQPNLYDLDGFMSETGSITRPGHLLDRLPPMPLAPLLR